MGEAKHATVQERFTGSAPALLARCDVLHHRDKAAEKHGKLLLALGIMSFVGAFGGFFVAGVSGIDLLMVLPFLLGFAGVAALVARSFVLRGDIEDRKLYLASGLVRQLEPELKAGKPLDMDLDFRAHHKLPPKEKSGGAWGPKSYAYEHPWFELRVVLQDGTKAKLSAVTKAKRKTKPKRKYTKIKERCVDHFVVELSAPQGRSFGVQQLPRMTSSGGMRLVRAQVKARSARLEWAGPALQRTRSRYGWQVNGQLLDAPAALGALITSYKTLAAAQRQAA